MDLRVRAVLDGYLHELGLFAPHFNSVFTSAASLDAWILVALVPASLAYALAGRWRGPSAPVEPPPPRHFYLLLVSGLLALAALGYLPYAVSLVRYGAQRQLLVAGLLVYVVALLPLFFWVLPRLALQPVEGAVLAVLAFFITVNGMENRNGWVHMYRRNESFLSALAAAVPHPNSGTTIVVQVHNGRQARELSGLHNLQVNFQQAVRYMYGDAT